MPNPDYEAGHLVQLYWTPLTADAYDALDAIDAPAMATAIAAMAAIGNITAGDLESGSMSETTEITIRGQRIDSHFVSPVMKRDPWSFTITLIPGDAQQAALNTAYQTKTVHAWMQRGLDPAGAPSDAYELVTGVLTNFKRVAPYGNGPVRAELSIRPSGPMIIDGVVVGEAA